MTENNILTIGKHSVKTGGVKQELSADLQEKVINFRNEFVDIFTRHYHEKLPVIRGYVDMPATIDTIKLEILLRGGFDVAIGKNVFDKDVILGYVTRNNSNDLTAWAMQHTLTGDNIKFIISEKERCTKYREIISSNHWQTERNFIVVRNKVMTLNDDFSIVRHYAEALAEIQASRFSLAVQSKVMTVFRGEIGDETINQFVSALYNGSPILKTSKLFDVEENIIHVDNPLVSENLKTLKQEYNNHLSELHNLLGLNSTGIDKQSGVSEDESGSNNADVKTNENVYLNHINKQFKNYSEQFPLFQARAVFNSLTVQEVSKLAENSNSDERERAIK